jgi:hypothetical protein
MNIVTTLATPNAQPTRAEIANRAYEIFQRRGCQHGYDVSDWLQAEYELRQMPTSAMTESSRPVKATTANKPARGRKRNPGAELAVAA